MNVRENRRHRRTRRRQFLVHEPLGLNVRDQVRRAHREAGEQVEARDHGLNVIDELARALRAKVIVDRVNQRSARRLAHDALGQLAILDGHRTLEVHDRKGRRDDLRTRPRRVLAAEGALDLGKDVHGHHLGNLHARQSDAVDARHGVLKQLNDWAVRAGADDVPQHGRQVPQLCGRGNRLGHVHVHLVTVKVCVIRASGRDVETERGIRQNHHAVRHHRGLVQRRLAVEEHNVSIQQMAVHHIALAEIQSLGIHEAQRHRALVLLEEHRLGARVLIGSVADVAHQTVAVVDAHNLGEGQVHGNLQRHTQLVQLDIGVGRNDGAGGEVHALAHQVSTDTARLGTEAGLESAERTARPLGRRCHALDVVVDIGGHIILQKRSVAINDLRRLALVHAVTQALVVAEDRNQNVRQIVLHALVVVHHHGRADRQRRNGKHRAHHPLRAGEQRIEAEGLAVLVRDALESPQNHLCLQGCWRSRLRGHLTLCDGKLALQRRRLAHHLGHLGKDRGVAHGAEERLLLSQDIANLLEAAHPWRRVRARAGQGCRAVQAHAIAELLDHIEELVEIHGPSQRNVSKVSRAVLVGLLAGRADLAVLNHSETRIKHAIRRGIPAEVGLVGGDLYDAALDNVIGVSDAKLNAYDCVTHCTIVILPCRLFVFW